VYADGPIKRLKILVTGGAGSVGAHTIQFAKHGGASIVTTISDDQQAAVAKAAGADLIIDRHKGDQVVQMQTLGGSSNERSIDRVIEVAFGVNLGTTMRVLKVNGIIATYSSNAEPEPTLPFWPLLRLSATIHFILLYNMSVEAHRLAIDAINVGLRDGWLQPRIAARFDQAPPPIQLIGATTFFGVPRWFARRGASFVADHRDWDAIRLYSPKLSDWEHQSSEDFGPCLDEPPAPLRSVYPRRKRSLDNF
jgi:NADPH:quinone reductase-like Zn-dependent oxidoreductase